ncbi:hypothetical protein [Paracoccus niistensis]|uniref:Glycosyl transferase n=1 Tax=Paracoccus niistensis TaxID=632935 RepID=A0ABV6HYZ1_9RHOB
MTDNPDPNSRQAEREARKARRIAEREARRAERQAERAGRAKPARENGSPARATESPLRIEPAQAQADFDILVVGQGGGIDRQAAILAASLRRNAPGFRGRLIVAEPQPEGAWSGIDPRMSRQARAALEGVGAEIRPLVARDFGRSYPYGNKIEALALLDTGRSFLFLDSDTLILGEIGTLPFDFAHPSASMRREGSWPQPPAYRQTYASIWRSLYDRFGLDMDGSLDLSQPEEHWERFLYFNAGWFFGADGPAFGRRFRDWAVALRDDPGEALACQSLDPWLDQVVLPLVIHSFGGGRPGPGLAGLDGDITWHYRNLPLLYARGPQRAIDEFEAVAALPEIVPLLSEWEAAERLLRAGEGRRTIRPMFADYPVHAPERGIRKRLKQAELWLD